MNNNYYTIENTPEFQTTSYNLWQPEGATNKKIQVDTGINSNWNYRKYMQNNANEIMKFNTMQAINSSGNNPYIISNIKPTENTPFLYNSIHDTSSPAWGFRNSDLKQEYMTKEQMKSRMVSPTIPTNF